nr:la-related protein 1C-like [Ipomoea batatas]
MATASSNPAAPNHHSPRSTAAAEIGSPGLNSPKSRRSSSTRGVSSSPWTQIVRGPESDSVPVAAAASGAILQSPHSPSSASVAQEQLGSSPDFSASATAGNSSPPAPEDTAAEAQGESPENGSGSNAAKKPVWNKPNGAKEIGAVMGAVSWPALSESTKASPKPSPSDLPKAISEGSLPASQGTGTASSSSSPHKQLHTTNNANPSSTPNHAPNRQRSFKRGGGNSSNNSSANGNFSQQQQPHGSVADMTTHNSEKSGNSGAELSSRDNVHRDGGQRGGFGSQSHGGNEHQHHRSNNRRGNGGPRPRGDGSYNHGHGGARDQDRGGQEWTPNRNFSGRDAHMQPPQRFPARPFIRGPPTPPPFIPPAVPMRPFNPPIIYPGPPPPESFRMPMIGPMSPVFYHVPDPQLHNKIVNQIDYYFSNENLIKDMYLRENMDDQGWVPIKLIAGFKKAKNSWHIPIFH